MEIAILLYDQFTALDCIGPYEVLSRLPGADLKFVAKTAGPVRADTGVLAITADYALTDVPHPDILLIPGGPGDEAAAADPEILAWVRAVHETTTWTTSVCTGSALLARAGLLDGRHATSDMRAFRWIVSQGPAVKWVRRARWVDDGKFVTSSSVSAGIEMALHVIARTVDQRTSERLARHVERLAR